MALVARVTAAPLATVVGWLARWGVDQQFSGGARGGAGARGAPASSAPLPDGSGVALRVGAGRGREVVVRAKRRLPAAAAFGGGGARGGEGRGEAELVLVTALTNAPDDVGVRRLLERLARDVLASFLETRIHYPR